MSAWLVQLTDGSVCRVDVSDHLPEHRAEYVARCSVHDALIIEASNLNAFSAKPVGCTGFAHDVHFGAENACPIHGNQA